MISLDGREPEVAIRDFVRAWFKKLASGEADEAVALIDEPDNLGAPWTPQSLQAAIDAEFHPESIFRREHPEGLRITDPDTAGDLWPSAEEIVSNDERDWFEYPAPIPLSDEWSDLSAMFEFSLVDGRLRVTLGYLHVL